MRKRIASVLFLISSAFVFCQERVIAIKEHIAWIKVGEGDDCVNYRLGHDGFYSPGAPMIDEEGRVFFLRFSKEGHRISVLKNGHLETKNIQLQTPIQIPAGIMEWNSSQQGYNGSGDSFMRVKDNTLAYYFTEDKRLHELKETKSYIMPFGGIIETNYPKRDLYSFEINTKGNVIRDYSETREWLNAQKGIFSIDENKVVMRDGIPWSVEPVKNASNAIYAGKTLSGHNIWFDGNLTYLCREIAFGNSVYMPGLIIEFPWRQDGSDKKKGSGILTNYGIGPWGEIYCVIAPPLMQNNHYYEPVPGARAELVVVRNHLKYFGRTIMDRVRIRKEPSAKTDIIKELSLKTGFKILDRDGKKETIEGRTANWMKVQLLDGTEGWVFGAYVQNLYDGPNGKSPPWPNVADW